MGLTQSHPVRDKFSALPKDVLLEIANMLDIRSLVRLARTNHILRSIVKDVLHWRITGHLVKFVPYPRITSFLTMLTDTYSVVGGSIAQAVISPHIFDKRFTDNLNIYAPAGRLTDWEEYLGDIGYIYSKKASPNRRGPQRWAFSPHNRERAPNKVIVVCVSGGQSCLPPLLSAPYTSQMNFFTKDHVYCTYPHLIPKHQTVRVNIKRITAKGMDENARLESRGMSIVKREQEAPLCQSDLLCRSQVRLTASSRPRKPSEFFGIMSWGADEERFLQLKRVQFQLGGRCLNRNCGSHSIL